MNLLKLGFVAKGPFEKNNWLGKKQRRDDLILKRLIEKQEEMEAKKKREGDYLDTQ